MKIQLILDGRYTLKNGLQQVKIDAILTGKVRTRIGLNVYLTPEQWDHRAQKVINTPDSDAVNRKLSRAITAADNALRERCDADLQQLTARSLKALLYSRIFAPTEYAYESDHPYAGLQTQIQAYCNSRAIKDRTKALYAQTAKHVSAYCGDVPMADITPPWPCMSTAVQM